MRIWSLHPKYLDTRGLVALWREGLLAQHVLCGRTRGYTNHPQLERFKNADRPSDAINQYLAAVYDEACLRSYAFNKSKVRWDYSPSVLTVTTGQLAYEREHLLKKLHVRDADKYREVLQTKTIEAHPLFSVMDGGIESWERVRD